MMIETYKTNLDGVLVIEPVIHADERGFFYESYNSKNFKHATELDIDFVQDNHSKSNFGVVRGLHYQEKPYEQGKLVRVIKGKIFDVAVDINKNSPSYGKYYSIELSADNKKQLWIPAGYAHGFMSLEDETEVLYKATNFYSKPHEKSIHWKNNDFSINWPDIKVDVTLSKKDTCEN